MASLTLSLRIRRSQVRVLPSALQKALRLQDKPGPTVSLLRRPEGAHRQAAPSLGIVEDDPEGVAFAGAQRAHAVADVDPVVATLTFDGAVIVGKDQHLALIEVNGLSDRLRPRALGHEQELPAGVVFFAAAQDRQNLEGE